MPKDLSSLERAFKDYTGNLPNYKRSAVYEYINALKAEIESRDKEINDLAEQLIKKDARIDELENTPSDHYEGPL